MSQIGIAVVGCGTMGHLFARIIDDLPELRLAGVVDLDIERAESLGVTYSVPFFTEPERMYASEDFDAVLIATPDHAHLEPCKLAAKNGKAILVEKPLATTVAEAKLILKVAKDNDVRLMVGHTLRFDPRYIEGKASVPGRIGDISYIKASRCGRLSLGKRLARDTSVANFLGIHDIDAMLWYTNSRVKSVFAVQREGQVGDGIADVILSVLEFENGVIASSEISWILPESAGGRRTSPAFDVIGKKGEIHIRAYENGIDVFSDESVEVPNLIYNYAVYGRNSGIYQAEIRHFADCVKNNQEPAVNSDDALEAVKVVQAIHRSLDTGKAVELSEVEEDAGCLNE